MRRLISHPKEKNAPQRVVERKKRQFSKIHVIFADCLVAFVWISWVMLQLLDKTVPSDLAMSLVSIYGSFATGGYFAVNAIRDTSLNKHGIHVPQPGTKLYIPQSASTDTPQPPPTGGI